MAKKVVKQDVLSKGDEVLSKVNAVNTALKNFPVLFESEFSKINDFINSYSFNFSFNLLRILGFTDEKLTNFIASLLNDTENSKGETIANGILSQIEESVKAILLFNLKNLFTCSMDPFIPDELMDPNKGIDVNLAMLDLYDTLRHSPFDTKDENGEIVNPSSIYYFDTEGYNPSTIKKSCDFNAFLWYVKNKGSEFAWSWDNRVQYYKKEFNIPSFKDGFFDKQWKSTGDTPTMYFEYEGKDYPKKEILYCRYREVSPDNFNSTNALKVWINPRRYKNSTTVIKKNLVNANLVNEWGQLVQQKIDKWGPENYQHTGTTKEKLVNKFKTQATQLNINLTNAARDTAQALNAGFSLNKTIFEFNYDYIYSLKLFDSKTLAANIISAIFKILNGINVSLSVEKSDELITRQELVKKFVRQVMYEDEFDYSDDYFEFSNDEFERMMEEMIDIRNGVMKTDEYGEQEFKVDSLAIMSAIKHIDDAETSEEKSQAINDALRKAMEALKDAEPVYKNVNDGYYTSLEPKIDIGFNIIEQLMEETVTQIVMQALSPKVFLLYIINLKVMGDMMDGSDVNVSNIGDFIENIKNLIINVIKEIKNKILEQLYNTIIKELTAMLKQYVLLLAKEKLEYYKILLMDLLSLIGGSSAVRSMINGIKNLRSMFKGETEYHSLDISDVDYMDMVPEKTKPDKK